MQAPGRENFSAGSSLTSRKPQRSRRGKSPISKIRGQEHDHSAQTQVTSQATCLGWKCHITHKVRKGSQAFSHQPRTWLDSKLSCKALTRGVPWLTGASLQSLLLWSHGLLLLSLTSRGIFSSYKNINYIQLRSTLMTSF